VTSRDPAANAVRLIRSCTSGLLRLDEVFHPCRFVLDPATGHPVVPMPPEWDPRLPAGSDERGVVLYIPDDSDPVAQLVVLPEPIDPSVHEAADRWAAYHGSIRVPAWALLRVESARCGGEVLDGEGLVHGNPLRADEPRLIRELNADRERLARLCERGAGVRPQAPMAVGADPDGIDVRASLGVIRVEFRAPCADAGAARHAIDALVGDGAG